MESKFQFTVFGSGSLGNTIRNPSCIGLSYVRDNSQSQCWLFDCGDGALRQMIRHSGGFKRTRINKIFITHLHIDHVAGINAIIADMGLNHSNDKSRWVVDIYGPHHLASSFIPMLYYSEMGHLIDVHIHEFLEKDMELDDISDVQNDNIIVSAIYPDESGYWTCFNDKLGWMRSGTLKHVVPCWGFCFQESLPILPTKQGKNDRTVLGKKIAIFGDTCNSSAMSSIVNDCDVLFHELSYGPIITDLEFSMINEREDRYNDIQKELLKNEKYQTKWKKIENSASIWTHSTAEMTGKYAKSVNAKQLVMIHIGARYEAKSPSINEKINKLLINQVNQFYKGPIVLCSDGTIVDI